MSVKVRGCSCSSVFVRSPNSLTGAGPSHTIQSVSYAKAMAQAALVLRPATKKAQREASVEGLLMAARALFVSQGYRHTTVDEIALAAHLTKGAVYFYFRNKE